MSHTELQTLALTADGGPGQTFFCVLILSGPNMLTKVRESGQKAAGVSVLGDQVWDSLVCYIAVTMCQCPHR